MPCCNNKIQPSTDEEFAPLENRQCRDLIVLFIFIGFTVGMGCFATVALDAGEPARLLNGVDSFGNTCGSKNDKIPGVNHSGLDLTHRTKVFFFDDTLFDDSLAKSDTHAPTLDRKKKNADTVICIKKCPGSQVDVEEYYTVNGTSLCVYGVTPYVDDITKCPESPVPKQFSILNRCIPDILQHMGNQFSNTFAGSGTSEVVQKVMADLNNTWDDVVILSGVAVLVAFIIVLVMRLLSAVIVWTLLLLAVVFSLAITVYCWYAWISLGDEYDAIDADKRTEEDEDTVDNWLIYAIISTAVTIIILLIIVAMWSRIALVVQLFAEAGRAISNMPFLLLQPVWTLLSLLCVVAITGIVALHIEYSGSPEVHPRSGHVTFVLTDAMTLARWYNLFAFFWFSAFIIACQDMIVAIAVSTWYFTRNKSRLSFPILRAYKRLICYHLGSVAFGSGVIAFVQFINLLLTNLQRKLEGRTSKCAVNTLKCLRCCLWCFERFLKYLNTNAYIEIAIYGYSFFEAAKKAFLVIVANVLRVAAINSIGDFVLFLGKMVTVVIVIIVGCEMLRDRDSINYKAIPIGFACLIAFFVSHSFLLIYEITIDTVFICFCEDCEKNDGDLKPYFMSKNLGSYLDGTAQKATSSSRSLRMRRSEQSTSSRMSISSTGSRISKGSKSPNKASK